MFRRVVKNFKRIDHLNWGGRSVSSQRRAASNAPCGGENPSRPLKLLSWRQTEASVSRPGFLHSLWPTSMTVYITTSSMLMEAFCSCGTHTHTHTVSWILKSFTFSPPRWLCMQHLACSASHTNSAPDLHPFTHSFTHFIRFSRHNPFFFSPSRNILTPSLPLNFFSTPSISHFLPPASSSSAWQKAASLGFGAARQSHGFPPPAVLTAPLKCKQPLLSQIYSVSLYFHASLNTVQARCLHFLSLPLPVRIGLKMLSPWAKSPPSMCVHRSGDEQEALTSHAAPEFGWGRAVPLQRAYFKKYYKINQNLLKTKITNRKLTSVILGKMLVCFLTMRRSTPHVGVLNINKPDATS